MLKSVFGERTTLSAMAVVPPAWIGGTNLTSGSVAALLFILRSVTSARGAGMFEALLRVGRLGWLSCFFAVAAAGSLFLPYLFAGDIMVYGRATNIAALEPSAANFAQTVYLASRRDQPRTGSAGGLWVRHHGVLVNLIDSLFCNIVILSAPLCATRKSAGGLFRLQPSRDVENGILSA
jgi:hypothetical protein